MLSTELKQPGENVFLCLKMFEPQLVFGMRYHPWVIAYRLSEIIHASSYLHIGFTLLFNEDKLRNKIRYSTHPHPQPPAKVNTVFSNPLCKTMFLHPLNVFKESMQEQGLTIKAMLLCAVTLDLN
jgi:hypothetical protein